MRAAELLRPHTRHMLIAVGPDRGMELSWPSLLSSTGGLRDSSTHSLQPTNSEGEVKNEYSGLSLADSPTSFMAS